MATDYEPEALPTVDAELLYRELSRIAAAIKGLRDGELVVTYVEPLKPRRGVSVYADGTQWDPGSGEGVYTYDGTAWVFGGGASLTTAEVLVGAATTAFSNDRVVTNSDTADWVLTATGAVSITVDETLDWL